MRALIFGQTGVYHKGVRDALCDYAYQQHQPIHWIDFEDEIVNIIQGYGMFTHLLSSDSEFNLKKTWKDAFQKLLAKINKEPNVIISMHATFFRANRFLVLAKAYLLKSFKPVFGTG